ncbi:MAG: hypothetical protein JO189_09905 [Deltaproteobacteria bacterium]|nr:hypothetical protein [Deltaproteobacteria bacterium]
MERLQLLACTVEIRTELPEFAYRLRYVTQHADQDHVVTDHAAFDVAREGENYIVCEDGAVIFSGRAVEMALVELFERMHARAFAALPDDIRIHAASGMDQGRMFLLVGNPFSGKTTLSMHLLLEGMEMIGDELVLLRNGLAVAFPRKFYPRESSLPLLPGLRLPGTDLPCVFDADGAKRIAIDPAALGRLWHIARAPVKAVFYLDPDFSRKTRVYPCTKVEMVRLVMEQCTPPLSRRKGWIADLCDMINGATARMIAVGDFSSIAVDIRKNLR